MPLLDLNAEDRAPSIRAMRAGHIRLGTYNAEARHPEESDTFIFTSADPSRLKPLAAELGGTIEQYTPQGAGEEPWRLISEADAFTGLLPFGDEEANLSQDWTLWGRMGLKRRCDGFDAALITVDEITGEISEETVACICAAKEKRECSPATRLRVFIPSTGLVLWELVTHSVIAAQHLFDQVKFVGTIAGGRMNHLPVRLVWAPRQIAYFDEKEGKRRTTTKRVVSLSIAGDAEHALAALGQPADQALLTAVRAAMGTQTASPALGPGEVPEARASDGGGAEADETEERRDVEPTLAHRPEASSGGASEPAAPVTDPKFEEGPHAGKHFSEVAQSDPEYMRGIIAATRAKAKRDLATAWLDHYQPRLG
jgi:hypothetical protein